MLRFHTIFGTTFTGYRRDLTWLNLTRYRRDRLQDVDVNFTPTTLTFDLEIKMN